MTRIAVVGAGRVGLSLGRALSRAGVVVTVCARRVRPLPHPLGASVSDLRAAVAGADVVVLCVPDDAITAVAEQVAATGAITSDHVVLHASGRLTRAALAPLEATGAGLGSWHPLQSFSAPDGTPEAFVDAPAVVEGDARAIVAARDLAAVLRMQPVLMITPEAKVRYHAAAVFASNYLVVLADVAGRLAREAGLSAGEALFQPLMRRTLENLAVADPASALTGPVRRGDAATVAAHLGVLEGDTRELYRLLALEAARIAEGGGAEVSEVRRVLRGERSTENGEQR